MNANGSPNTGAAYATLTIPSPVSAAVGGDDMISFTGLSISLTKGDLFAVVVRNTDGSPATNYCSMNYLNGGISASQGTFGANGRNEMRADAPDVFYGLDPRETVIASNDSGATWNYSNDGIGASPYFLPCYVQEYGDGSKLGQPYYTATITDMDVGTSPTVRYNALAKAQTFTYLGAWLGAPDTLTISLKQGSTTLRSAVVSGIGPVRVPITPISFAAGDTFDITSSAINNSGALYAVYGNSGMTALLGLGASAPFYFTTNTARTVPIYPLPFVP